MSIESELVSIRNKTIQIKKLHEENISSRTNAVSTNLNPTESSLSLAIILCTIYFIHKPRGQKR